MIKFKFLTLLLSEFKQVYTQATSRAPYSLKNIRQRDLKFSQTRQIFLGLVILNQKNLTQYAGILDSRFGNHFLIYMML